jgi:hypothetical protein
LRISAFETGAWLAGGLQHSDRWHSRRFEAKKLAAPWELWLPGNCKKHALKTIDFAFSVISHPLVP